MIVTTEYMIRVVGADHLDLVVGSVVGSGPPYVIHVHALDESKQVVLSSVTIAIEADIDETTKREVLLVYTRCVVERADKEKRRLTLKGIFFEEESQNRFIPPNRDSHSATPPPSRRRRARP